MEIFKQAIFEKLRIPTGKGLMSAEQVCDLPITELDALALSLEKEYNESGKKSFIAKKSVKDKKAKLVFDVVVEILTTKVEAAEAATESLRKKNHNTKILELIAEKKDEALKGKSLAQLEAMLESE